MDDQGESPGLAADRPSFVPSLTDLCCQFLARHNELLFERCFVDSDTINDNYDDGGDSLMTTPRPWKVNVDVDFVHGDETIYVSSASSGDEDDDDGSATADDVATLACTSGGKLGDGVAADDFAKSPPPQTSSRSNAQRHPHHRPLWFRPGAKPPRGLAERLLDALRCHCERERQNDGRFLRAFADEQCCLQHLNLKNSYVTDHVLRRLLDAHGAQLVTLDLTACDHLTPALNARLASSPTGRRRRYHAPTLTSLTLNGGALRLFERWLRGRYAAAATLAMASASLDEPSTSATTFVTSQALASTEAAVVTSVATATLGDRAAPSVPPASSPSATSSVERDDAPPPQLERQRRRAVKRRSSGASGDKRTTIDKSNDAAMPSRPGDASDSNSSPGSSNNENTLDFYGSCNEAAPCTSSGHSKNLGDSDRPHELTLTTIHGDERSSGFANAMCDVYMLKNPIFTDICPNLAKLVLHGDELEQIWSVDEVIDKERVVWEFFARLLHPLEQHLRYLDISHWSNVNDLSFLEHGRLTTLVLHDVPDLYKTIDVLCTLNRLEYLDLSQSRHETGQYLNPVTTLTRLIASLPELRCLDISVTNLALNPTKGDWPTRTERHVESDIYGLQGLGHKLDFLGIFYCDAASYFQRIPALAVSGDANEPQLLLAAEKYLHRPRLLLSVLNEMFQTYKFGALAVEKTRALHLLLDSMREHDANVNVQIASSASLFYVMRSVKMSFSTRARVISLLLNAMDNFMQEQTLVRNCCLSLCQFDVAAEMSHVYVDAFRVLLKVIREYTDTMIQRLVVHILNSLACSGQNEQKVAVGQLGALNVMLNLITQRLDAQNCDEVMEMAWSFLWNITDETPINCQLFLDEGGMDLFKKCHEAFPDKNGLMRNMMGLVGNIAEVRELRHKLMNGDYVAIFCELLHNISDGIEISYNSAGVLAHMLSSGHSTWTILFPDREFVSLEVIAAVKSWQLTSKRYINYRSFEPIVRLVGENTSDASRYWAVWALANLTTVDGAKYCKFVIDEGGVDALTKATSQYTDANFRDLVSIVLRNVANYVTVMMNSS